MKSFSSQRSLVACAFSLALAYGCTSPNPYYAFNDAGPEAGSIKTDGGSTSTKKKDAASEEEEEEGTDASVTKTDASKKDSSTTTTTCAPGSVTGFTPQWKAPAAIHSGACTTAQVDALMCLFDANADPTTCQNAVDDANNAGCFKCIYTDASSSAPGPVIIDGAIGSLNFAGCIARTSGNATSTGCGAKVQAADQCADEACNVNCPVPDDDDGTALDARNTCQEDALAGGCSTYATDAECADTALDGGASVCASGSTFLDRAKAYAKLFCVL